MSHPHRLISSPPLAALLAACNSEVGGEPMSSTTARSVWRDDLDVERVRVYALVKP